VTTTSDTTGISINTSITNIPTSVTGTSTILRKLRHDDNDGEEEYILNQENDIRHHRHSAHQGGVVNVAGLKENLLLNLSPRDKKYSIEYTDLNGRVQIFENGRLGRNNLNFTFFRFAK
jgi:hypothetical protein